MPAHPVSAPNKLSQPKTHQIHLPNNVPKPPHQQTPTTPLSKLSTLSSQILKGTSRAWKSFQKRSLANDQRYNLHTLLPTKKKRSSISQPIIPSFPVPQHRPPPQSPPYPDTDPIYSSVLHQASANEPLLWQRHELPPSLFSATPALSHAARVMPYQPGHRPALQSPYYLLVCLPESHADSIQQQQQLGYTVQDLINRRPSPSNHHAVLCSPYRPYRTTVPTSSAPGGTASGEL